MKSKAYAIFILSCASACGSTDESDPAPDKKPTAAEIEGLLRGPGGSSEIEPTLIPLSSRAAEAVAQIKKKVEAVLASTACDVNNNKDACKFLSISNKAKEFTWDEEKFRTLVIDASGMGIHSLVGLNGRVLGYYEFSGRTDIFEPDLIYKNTADHIRIFRDIVGKQRSFLPTRVLQEAMSGFKEEIRGLNEEVFDVESRTGHGFMVASILAEYAPYSSFAYLDSNIAGQIRSEICGRDLNELRRIQRKMTSGIIALVRRHRITHINESAGLDINGLSAIWEKSGCVGHIPKSFALEVLKINLEEYLIPIGSLDGVLYVQAATNSSLSADAAKGEFANDCDNSKTPNRIRIAYFNEHDREVPAGGMSLSQAADIGFELSSTPGCVDLYVGSGRMNSNLGPDNEVRDTAFNLSIRNEWPRTKAISNDYQYTSWAAPLATAYIQHLEARSALGRLTPAERIKALTGDGKLSVHDPLRNKQLSYFDFL